MPPPASSRLLSSELSIGGSSSQVVKTAKVLSGEMVHPISVPAEPTSPTQPWTIFEDAQPTSRPVGAAAQYCPLRLGPFDGLNLRLWFLESTHFYVERLDTAAIRSSLIGLLTRYPSFAGRVQKSIGSADIKERDVPIWCEYQVITPNICSDDGGVPVLEIEVEGTVGTAMVDPKHRNARGFANIPNLSQCTFNDQEIAAKTPLFTVTVVHFVDGGSALAVAVSHGLVDGKGFAELMKMWSFAFEYGWDHCDVPKLLMERPLCLFDGKRHEASPPKQSNNSLKGNGNGETPCAYDVRTPQDLQRYTQVFEPMIWNCAGKPRARMYFTWAELSVLKTTTPCHLQNFKSGSTAVALEIEKKKKKLSADVLLSLESSNNIGSNDMVSSDTNSVDQRRESGTQLPSSSVALAARVWIAFSKLMLPHPSSKRLVQPYLLAQLRSPRHPEIPPQFAGNCVQNLYGAFIAEHTDLGAVCGEIHAASGLVDGEAAQGAVADAFDMKIQHLAKGRMLANFGKGVEEEMHLLQINAKQSFRVLNIEFGAGVCCGYIPCNLGSDMQIVEAHGGLHVYLGCPSWAMDTAPTNWTKAVETTAFRNQILSMSTNPADAASTLRSPMSSMISPPTLPTHKVATESNLRQLRLQLEQMKQGSNADERPSTILVPKSNTFCATGDVTTRSLKMDMEWK